MSSKRKGPDMSVFLASVLEQSPPRERAGSRSRSNSPAPVDQIYNGKNVSEYSFNELKAVLKSLNIAFDKGNNKASLSDKLSRYVSGDVEEEEKGKPEEATPQRGGEGEGGGRRGARSAKKDRTASDTPMTGPFSAKSPGRRSVRGSSIKQAQLADISEGNSGDEMVTGSSSSSSNLERPSITSVAKSARKSSRVNTPSTLNKLTVNTKDSGSGDDRDEVARHTRSHDHENDVAWHTRSHDNSTTASQTSAMTQSPFNKLPKSRSRTPSKATAASGGGGTEDSSEGEGEVVAPVINTRRSRANTPTRGGLGGGKTPSPSKRRDNSELLKSSSSSSFSSSISKRTPPRTRKIIVGSSSGSSSRKSQSPIITDSSSKSESNSSNGNSNSRSSNSNNNSSSKMAIDGDTNRSGGERSSSRVTVSITPSFMVSKPNAASGKDSSGSSRKQSLLSGTPVVLQPSSSYLSSSSGGGGVERRSSRGQSPVISQSQSPTKTLFSNGTSSPENVDSRLMSRKSTPRSSSVRTTPSDNSEYYSQNNVNSISRSGSNSSSSKKRMRTPIESSYGSNDDNNDDVDYNNNNDNAVDNNVDNEQEEPAGKRGRIAEEYQTPSARSGGVFGAVGGILGTVTGFFTNLFSRRKPPPVLEATVVTGDSSSSASSSTSSSASSSSSSSGDSSSYRRSPRKMATNTPDNDNYSLANNNNDNSNEITPKDNLRSSNFMSDSAKKSPLQRKSTPFNKARYNDEDEEEDEEDEEEGGDNNEDNEAIAANHEEDDDDDMEEEQEGAEDERVEEEDPASEENDEDSSEMGHQYEYLANVNSGNDVENDVIEDKYDAVVNNNDDNNSNDDIVDDDQEGEAEAAVDEDENEVGDDVVEENDIDSSDEVLVEEVEMEEDEEEIEDEYVEEGEEEQEEQEGEEEDAEEEQEEEEDIDELAMDEDAEEEEQEEELDEDVELQNQDAQEEDLDDNQVDDNQVDADDQGEQDLDEQDEQAIDQNDQARHIEDLSDQEDEVEFLEADHVDEEEEVEELFDENNENNDDSEDIHMEEEDADAASEEAHDDDVDDDNEIDNDEFEEEREEGDDEDVDEEEDRSVEIIELSDSDDDDVHLLEGVTSEENLRVDAFNNQESPLGDTFSGLGSPSEAGLSSTFTLTRQLTVYNGAETPSKDTFTEFASNNSPTGSLDYSPDPFTPDGPVNDTSENINRSSNSASNNNNSRRSIRNDASPSSSVNNNNIIEKKLLSSLAGLLTSQQSDNSRLTLEEYELVKRKLEALRPAGRIEVPYSEQPRKVFITNAAQKLAVNHTDLMLTSSSSNNNSNNSSSNETLSSRQVVDVAQQPPRVNFISHLRLSTSIPPRRESHASHSAPMSNGIASRLDMPPLPPLRNFDKIEVPPVNAAPHKYLASIPYQSEKAKAIESIFNKRIKEVIRQEKQKAEDGKALRDKQNIDFDPKKLQPPPLSNSSSSQPGGDSKISNSNSSSNSDSKTIDSIKSSSSSSSSSNSSNLNNNNKSSPRSLDYSSSADSSSTTTTNKVFSAGTFGKASNEFVFQGPNITFSDTKIIDANFANNNKFMGSFEFPLSSDIDNWKSNIIVRQPMSSSTESSSKVTQSSSSSSAKVAVTESSKDNKVADSVDVFVKNPNWKNANADKVQCPTCLVYNDPKNDTCRSCTSKMNAVPSSKPVEKFAGFAPKTTTAASPAVGSALFGNKSGAATSFPISSSSAAQAPASLSSSSSSSGDAKPTNNNLFAAAKDTAVKLFPGVGGASDAKKSSDEPAKDKGAVAAAPAVIFGSTASFTPAAKPATVAPATATAAVTVDVKPSSSLLSAAKTTTTSSSESTTAKVTTAASAVVVAVSKPFAVSINTAVPTATAGSEPEKPSLFANKDVKLVPSSSLAPAISTASNAATSAPIVKPATVPVTLALSGSAGLTSASTAQSNANKLFGGPSTSTSTLGKGFAPSTNTNMGISSGLVAGSGLFSVGGSSSIATSLSKAPFNGPSTDNFKVFMKDSSGTGAGAGLSLKPAAAAPTKVDAFGSGGKSDNTPVKSSSIFGAKQ